jgi:hypothetical protein
VYRRQAPPVHDTPVIEIGMIRQDDDTVGRGDLFIGQFCCLQDFAFHRHSRNVGVGICDLRTPPLEQREHLEDLPRSVSSPVTAKPARASSMANGKSPITPSAMATLAQSVLRRWLNSASADVCSIS